MCSANGLFLGFALTLALAPRPASCAPQAPRQSATRSPTIAPIEFQEDTVSAHETEQHRPIRQEGSESKSGPIRYVQLKLVIGTDGHVLSAAPEQGPSQYYSRAVAEAMTWHYLPFEKKGVAVVATIVDYVQLLPPELPKRQVDPHVGLK